MKKYITLKNNIRNKSEVYGIEGSINNINSSNQSKMSIVTGNNKRSTSKFNHINIHKSYLRKVKNNKINAYYSLSNKKDKNHKNENVIIFLSEGSEVEKNYIQYADEYHAAGYDFYIVDISENKNAGSDLVDYLKLNYHGQLPKNILIHGNNDQRENALQLCKNRVAKKDNISGVILSSYLPENEFIFTQDLDVNTNIYFSYDHPDDDYKNNSVFNELLHKNKKVKKFSFTNREEYHGFSELNTSTNNKIIKSLNNNDLSNQSLNKPNIGMPVKDQIIFSQIAEKKGLIIGVRPIDTNSTSLISSGEYSSKNLAIKAKSSDWGPMAGFIPVDQSLAKSSAQKDLLKYNKAIEEAISSGVATVSELYISAERVNELAENKVITLPQDKNAPLKFEVIKDNKKYEFFLESKIIEGKQYYLVQRNHEFGIESVLVIADPISKNPMIADYDLFTVIYPYRDLGSETRVNKPLSWENWKASVNYDELTNDQKKLFDNQALYEKEQGSLLGFISQQVKDLKDELNTALDRKAGMEIVHHGADDANPFAVIHDNFPATFFVPKSLLDKPINSKNQILSELFHINDNGTVVLQSPEEFSKFQQLMIDLGYIAPLNEQWNNGINDPYFTKKRKISATFIETKNEIGRKLSIGSKDKYAIEYEEAKKNLKNGIYVKNNISSKIMGRSEKIANQEIENLLLPYNYGNDLGNTANNKNHRLPSKARKTYYAKRNDISWFERIGSKLLGSLMKKEGLFLNRTNELRFSSLFSLLSKYDDVNTPIYKSFYTENSEALKSNIQCGDLVAFDGAFHGYSNIEKAKKTSSNNVYIAIIGKHGAKPFTSLHSGSSERAIIAPGTHFRVVKNKIKDNKNYIILEVASEMSYQEPVFDLYDGKLKGLAIDSHRTTFSETVERKLNSSKLLNIFESWRGESLKSISIKNIVDKIIEGKISVEYAVHKYSKEISKIFSSEDSILLSYKLYHTAYDPLISKAFNQYLNKKITLEEWMDSYNVNYLNDNTINNVNRVKALLNYIYDIPTAINKLSDESISLLSCFFNIPGKDNLLVELFKISSGDQKYYLIIEGINYLISSNKKEDIFSSIEIKEVLGLIEQANNENELTKKLEFMDLNTHKNNSEEDKLRIHGVVVDKKLLIKLGAMINNEKIENIDIIVTDHDYSNLTFDAKTLNDYFLSASGTDEDKKAVLIIKKLLDKKEKNIERLISIDSERVDYITSHERLAKIIELAKAPLDAHYWDSLRKPSLKIPRHMKILSKVGYANITYSMWQSVNNTFSLAEQLNNPNLSAQERKEIITNLSLMWSEMAFNGVSELIEIAIAKGLMRYRHNPLEYVSKISTRIGVALNLLSIGFDIYNAYDNFSRISGESDEKRKIDYIVNGSFAVVSGLMTVGVSIAMLAGSTIAGPIGIVAGVVITLAMSIYHAARLIEESKKKIHFTPLEEFTNGFYAFLMGDILPDKKNKMVYLETEIQLEELIDKNAIAHFKEMQKQSQHSSYFYTNEKQVYQEHHYYKVRYSVLGKNLDSIINPIGEFIHQRISQNMSKQEAEDIAALSPFLHAEKTDYKYYLPTEVIATNEKLIFDIDFYANELNRYTTEIDSNDEDAIFGEMVDEDFFNNIKTTKEYVINQFGESQLGNGLIKISDTQKYYVSNWHGHELLYFNTHNGNDIIAAPAITQNTFDIYNGTKRLSGGAKNDVFNVFTSQSPRYASRFYGREGNDTLRLIKTTGEYTGYKVDLQHNYVKFKGAEDQTNSQNFHSKLYLYQKEGRYYSKKFIDSMPNVELQDKKVIAYLDSIENVMGSEIGDDIIYGNEEANYLNGGGSVDFLYGRGGNDTLVLNEGYAEGGEGNDSYIILRASLPSGYDKLFETIINESSVTESSVVKLNYTFDEISSIKRNGKDVIIHFKINNENKQDSFIYHSITLRNVYGNNQHNTLAHRYTLMTNDGFLLTANEKNKENALYQFSYLEQYSDQIEKMKSFYINENSRSIIISNGKKHKNIKLLSELQYSGFSSGDSLRFGLHGNNENNHYLSVTANSFIKISNGQDNYHLKTFLANKEHERINVSLSNYIDKLTAESVSNFFLSDISGFDLIFKEGVLSHRYLPDTHFKLIFEPKLLTKIIDSNMTIRIVDKDNIVFTLPTKESHSHLLMPAANLNLAISKNDDVLVIPESLILNKAALSTYHVNQLAPHDTPLSIALADKPKEIIELLPILELLEGDDIVVNHNNTSSVIDGGKGDDNIIVDKGHHILIAGEGNDRLSSGEGNDLLISQFGHDYLSGGKGSNVYVVQKRQGNVTVYDEGNHSHILVTGLTENDTLISSQINGNTQYQTQDKQFTLTVKTSVNKTNESELQNVIPVIEKSSVLSLQGLANIVHNMAQFNQQQLTTAKNTETVSLSTWSPLALVEKQL